MCAYAIRQNRQKDILPYTLPQLHTGKTWYVDFFCLDPVESAKALKGGIAPPVGDDSCGTDSLGEGLPSIKAFALSLNLQQISRAWIAWAACPGCRSLRLLASGHPSTFAGGRGMAFSCPHSC